MSCVQQAISCLELKILRLESSSNFLVPFALAYLLLVCFVSHIIIFWQIWSVGAVL